MNTSLFPFNRDQLVESVAQALQDLGYRSIRANAAGYQTPETIRWNEAESHQPDATAIAGGSRDVVVQVETPETIHENQTATLWRRFSEFCLARGRRFVVVVPRGFKSCAEERILSLGVTAAVLEA